MITEVYFIAGYYFYTRVGSGGRGVQASKKRGSKCAKWCTSMCQKDFVRTREGNLFMGRSLSIYFTTAAIKCHVQAYITTPRELSGDLL
jgi:hypothetical protein